MTDQVVADYERLNQLANRFANQTQSLQNLIQDVASHMNNLEGEWRGRGSDAFFAEMESEIIPASNRLIQAVENSEQTTRTIIQIMEQADEEAAAPLRTFANH